jgi:catechol 2,3-dioxygenase-like lactoylglutathione lyase family enzyme
MVALANVNLIVRDIAASERFYREGLGLVRDQERSAPPSFLLLQAGDCTLTLQSAQALGQDVRSGSAIELGFEVADLDTVKQRLVDLAVIPSAQQTMGWGSAFEVNDPDGNRLNIYVRNA